MLNSGNVTLGTDRKGLFSAHMHRCLPVSLLTCTVNKLHKCVTHVTGSTGHCVNMTDFHKASRQNNYSKLNTSYVFGA